MKTSIIASLFFAALLGFVHGLSAQSGPISAQSTDHRQTANLGIQTASPIPPPAQQINPQPPSATSLPAARTQFPISNATPRAMNGASPLNDREIFAQALDLLAACPPRRACRSTHRPARGVSLLSTVSRDRIPMQFSPQRHRGQVAARSSESSGGRASCASCLTATLSLRMLSCGAHASQT
jgi:hypothetical protein